MSKLQSKNITTLCLELGYSEDFVGRDPKTLTTAVTKFRKSFTEKGNDLPYGAPDSPEAQKFARAFCEENNRGQTLWPSGPDDSWPTWPSDQSVILESLAHIFALQAFHQYQYNLKKEKQKMPSAMPTLPSDRNTRELSPLSAKIDALTPIAPSGTRRRPAKKAGATADEIFEGNEYAQDQFYKNCENEIQSLDPRNDQQPIKEFTRQWLFNREARWPTTADIRVKTYMHDKNMYNTDVQDMKILPLTTSLRAGTEIEQGEGKDWKILETRTKERITFLAKEMEEKYLLKNESGTLKKLPFFRDLWMNRHSNYGPKDKVSRPAQKTKELDVVSTDCLPPDKSPTVRTPTANMFSKGHQTSSTTKVVRPESSGTRRKLDSIGESTPNEHQQKKRKKTPILTGNRSITTPPLDQSSVLPPVTDAEVASTEDAETAQRLAFARECLSSDFEREVRQPERAQSRRQSTPKETRPMTPTSPAVTNNTFQRSNRSVATPRRAVPVQSFDTRSASVTSPGIGNMQRSPALQAATFQAMLANPPPALVLEKADGSFDEDNPLPSAHFHNSNVDEFFSFVSETTQKPRDSFDSLTLTFLFASGDDRTWLIQEGDEMAWSKLQRKAHFLCKLWKTKTEESELQLVVEYGDKRKMFIY